MIGLISNIAHASALKVGNPAFRFGVEKGGLSASLRALADAIDAGDVFPQDVLHVTRASRDDYVTHRIIVRYVAREAAET